ncbi:hypothetical protein V2S66_00350 [Streptomyces sp. V4-01]|uniref:Lipoprotein n=1 Tax=Actinacidiphila polyblastidii TaxID=3110430 RepID=A0ABU7P564_9ACTN|nr:hypothetical protein [Streptomyces sp. V4-01]
MRIRLTAAALTAASVLALADCSSGADESATDRTGSPPRPSASTAAPGADPSGATPGADRSAAGKALGMPPAPAGASKAGLYAALEKIRPGLTHDDAATTDDIRNQCQNINTGGRDLGRSAAARFGVTAAEGDRIVAALKSSGVCKP